MMRRHASPLSVPKARNAHARPPHAKPGVFARLGPGLITGASDDDPSGIATYSQAGTQFGTALCWVLPFCFPFMAAIQEICARIGRVTGQCIAGNIRALFWSAVINGVVAVPLMALIMLTTMRREVMGPFILPRGLWLMGWACTAMMALAVATMAATW